MSEILAAGTAAPDFTLRVTPDQFLSLSEFRGQPVIVAFYPADWSPVCGDQMTLYNQVRPEFQRRGARDLGRQRLVPSGLRQTQQHPFPAARRLRAQGIG